MESKITVQDLILNLKAAGFTDGQIKDYLTMWHAGEISQQLRLLSTKRDILLDSIPQEEQQIHCREYQA